VRNGRLRAADAVLKDVTFETLNVSEFILEGPKELLQQIKAGVGTAKKGPVTITAARRDEKAMGLPNAPQPVRLRVASLTHVSEGCVELR